MQYASTQQTINEALPSLAAAVLSRGDEVGSRNGRCKELLHASVQLTRPWEREILLPDRRASLPAQIAESMWVLSGRNDIEWLSHYLPRAQDFSDNGKTWRGAYGPRIRSWRVDEFEDVDQLDHVVQLLRDDSLTRRAVINIYDPAIDTEPGKDIPCNNWIQLLNRSGQLHMSVVIRSNDLIWGWSGINAFEWSVLQEVVAGLLGISIGPLTFHIGSLHVYEKHWGRAQKLADTDELDFLPTPNDAPRFQLATGTRLSMIDLFTRSWFELEGKIRGGVHVHEQINRFPEPMMRSWLKVLEWWWQGAPGFAEAHQIIGSRTLAQAAVLSPGHPATKRLRERQAQPLAAVEDTQLCSPEPTFVETDMTANTEAYRKFVIDLHTTKDKAYGDSWRKRGEQVGILANIARKVDRLGVTDEHETAADTAIDLLLYLVKYRLWLAEHGVGRWPEGPHLIDHRRHAEQVAAMVNRLGTNSATSNEWVAIEQVQRERFETLLRLADVGSTNRWGMVDDMIADADMLARSRWAAMTWHAENATRSWNPEQETEDGDLL